MVRHAPIHRRSGHSDIAICCGRNVRGSSPSTLVVPLSNQVTTLNHKRFKGFKMFSDGHSANAGGPRRILDVEASHLALSKTEDVSDRLVLQPVRLSLKRFAFEIADGLPDLCNDRAVCSSVKAHRLDVRTDHGPLACPVLAYGLAAMDVATIHA